MNTLGQDEITCSGCGAKLAPGMRYCLACYRPVEGQVVTQTHSRLAGQLSTTRRPDPAIVFLPEVHEAMVRKRARRGRQLKIAVVAILVIAVGSVTWWKIAAVRKKAQEGVRREQMAMRELNMMADGFERFKRDVGRYPTTDEGIPSLLARPLKAKPGDIARLDRWSGPYMDGDFEVDPWGHDYVYQSSDGHFLVFSYGSGGETGGNIKLAVSSSQTPSQ